MAKYLDIDGVETLWDAVKTRDTNVQTAANNYTDTAVQNAQGTLQGNINGVSGRVTTLEGYFTSGKANEAVKATGDKNGNDIATTYIKTDTKGQANGVCPLDANAKVAAAYLPGYVDDIVEGYYHQSKFWTTSSYTTEITGEAGKLYVDLTTNTTYRWSGTQFTMVSESISIGTTQGTAYDGAAGAAMRSDVNTLQTAVEAIPDTYVPKTSTNAVSGTTLDGLITNDGNIRLLTHDDNNVNRSELIMYPQYVDFTTPTLRWAKALGSPKTIAVVDDITITSIETTGNGNAITSAALSSKKITFTKGSTFLTAHQTIKNLKTDNTSAQSTSASESITGSGTINLHKVSKTGSYEDLLNKPTIPVEYIKSLEQSGNTLNISFYNANGQLSSGSYTPSFVDTGATSVEEGISAGGNAVTSISYNASQRKLTYFKGTTFLTPSDVQTISASELADILSDDD